MPESPRRKQPNQVTIDGLIVAARPTAGSDPRQAEFLYNQALETAAEAFGAGSLNIAVVVLEQQRFAVQQNDWQKVKRLGIQALNIVRGNLPSTDA